MRDAPRVEEVSAAAYRVPTTWQGEPVEEADGTLTWDATTVVVVQVTAAGTVGTGWSYTDQRAVGLVHDVLAPAVQGRSATDVPAHVEAMVSRCRNLGRPGLVAAAVSAVETGLQDLRARLLGCSLGQVLGRATETVPVYGSGGFTNWPDERLAAQVERWLEHGVSAVKIKIGLPGPDGHRRDLDRVALVRQLVGPDVDVMVDANGAYTAKEAVRMAHRLSEHGVVWFEEPVSSDHVGSLRSVREQVECDVAAGEYGGDVFTLDRLVRSRAVDCLQIDVTRCGGMTEWQRAAAAARAQGCDVSAHCAPGLHRFVAAATPQLRHVEWFHDHVVLEDLLFDGAPQVRDSQMVAPLDVPGHGMQLRPSVADPYRLA
jgi:L-alanine-DL-glutamate epimerase-like enolase superfamily enzyme